MRFLLFIALLAVSPLNAIGQEDTVRSEYTDKKDFRMVVRGEKSLETNDEKPRKGKLISFVVPVIGSNPYMGFFYGLGGTGAMFVGHPKTTSISSMSTSILFTTKNQVIANLRVGPL